MTFDYALGGLVTAILLIYLDLRPAAARAVLRANSRRSAPS